MITTIFFVVLLCVLLSFGIGKKGLDMIDVNPFYAQRPLLYFLSLLMVFPTCTEITERLDSHKWEVESYFGSVSLYKLTGKSNQSILGESPENVWLDITTWTTKEEREEAYWKSMQEASAKAHAERVKAYAEISKNEQNEFHRFVASIPQDMVANLGTAKMFYMETETFPYYKTVPVYENEKEYVVISRDYIKLIFQKSNFVKSYRYNAFTCPTASEKMTTYPSSGIYPAVVTKSDHSIAFGTRTIDGNNIIHVHNII